MPSQHHAIGLQTGCKVTMLAPVVEAARLPRVCPMALGYGLPPCNNNNGGDVANEQGDGLWIQALLWSSMIMPKCTCPRETVLGTGWSLQPDRQE